MSKKKIKRLHSEEIAELTKKIQDKGESRKDYSDNGKLVFHSFGPNAIASSYVDRAKEQRELSMVAEDQLDVLRLAEQDIENAQMIYRRQVDATGTFRRLTFSEIRAKVLASLAMYFRKTGKTELAASYDAKTDDALNAWLASVKNLPVETEGNERQKEIQMARYYLYRTGYEADAGLGAAAIKHHQQLLDLGHLYNSWTNFEIVGDVYLSRQDYRLAAINFGNQLHKYIYQTIDMNSRQGVAKSIRYEHLRNVLPLLKKFWQCSTKTNDDVDLRKCKTYLLELLNYLG